MKEWSGLERVFRLSLGIELGANALALLAALEFKELLQKDLRGIEKNNQPVSLSSEEWRSAAGIFDRKAYDRAKAKLEDQRIVHIEREGRVLRVTLWPNLLKGEPDQAVEDLPEPQSECVDITRIASSEDNEVSVIMEALEKTGEETLHETTDRTAGETVRGTTHRTVDASIPETDRRIKPTPRLTSFSHSPLERYSLTRSSLTRYSQSNPIINPIRPNNEQRYNELRNNEQRYNELRIRDDPEKSNNIPLRSLNNPNGLIKVNGMSPTFKRLWHSEMGHALTRYEEEGIQRFVRLGYSEEILIEALRNAVLSDRRHMGYLLGILRNWYRAGVRQPRDITLIQQRWEDKRFVR